MSGSITIAPYDANRHRPEQLHGLFLDLYAHIESRIGRTLLRETAFELWIEGYERQARRSRLIVIAVARAPNGAVRLVGFAEGVVRFPPAYYREGPAGYVSHLFVREDARRDGVARRLWLDLREWFGEKGLTVQELQVVRANTGAEAFWRRQAFREDAVLMRRNNPEWEI